MRVVSAKVSLRNRFIEIWQARELVIFLVRKELKVRYKNSVLGFLWSFLNPALVLLVYYVVFKYFLANHISLFAIYLFAGLLPWNLFNNSLLSSAGVLVAQAGIVKKVSFPREILALAQVGTSICYFFFQACIMVAFLVGFQVMPDWKFLPVVLLALLCDVVFSAALAVFLSAVTVYLRDVQHLIEVLLVALFFSAPIVYMFTTVGTKLAKHGILWIYFLNPLVSIVLAFQRFIYGTVAPRDRPDPDRDLRGALVLRGARDHPRHIGVDVPRRDADLRQGRGQLRRGALITSADGDRRPGRLEAVPALQGEVHLPQGADSSRRARALPGLLGAQ